ncbi:MAG: hypothetical protein EA350_12895 [Gemmatimonadales bacterium]|nr:MAG: hypothetical protein EA350_12895 [Gemmatimonadales bacterium]
MQIDRSVLKWVLPVAALLPFAAIGIGQMLRGSPVRRLEGTAPSPGVPGFREAVSAVVGTALQGGSRAGILLNGDELFPRMWSDFERAERSISVHTFFWSDGILASELVRRLSERSRAGIAVRVLYDSIGAIGLSDRMFEGLRDAGVNQSLTSLDESMVAVLDRDFGRSMEEHFRDDLLHAREITLDAFRARPLRERVIERGAASLSRLV